MAPFSNFLLRYDVPEVVKYVDFLNVMTYDFHGHWEGQVGHNSPLYPLESASSHQRKLTVVRHPSNLLSQSIQCHIPFTKYFKYEKVFPGSNICLLTNLNFLLFGPHDRTTELVNG
jgi:Glycosyl hydrolases family 18